jgi:hypothetical protein
MALSGMDFLKANAPGTKAKKKKTEKPTIELPDTQKNRDLVEKWIEGKNDEVSGEAKRKAVEEVLRPLASDERYKLCQEDGVFYSSVNIKIGEKVIQFSAPCKYSVIPVEAEEALKEAFGEKYSQLFQDDVKINISDAGKKRLKELLPKLMEACGGKEQFFTLFEVVPFITVTEEFHRAQMLDKEVAEKAAPLLKPDKEGNQVIKPTTPSFSLA